MQDRLTQFLDSQMEIIDSKLSFSFNASEWWNSKCFENFKILCLTTRSGFHQKWQWCTGSWGI